MALFVLDTGILLGYARGAPFAQFVEDQFAPTQPPNLACVSVVSIGEIKCFPIRRAWAQKKRENLERLLRQVPVVDINREAIIQRYAEIATYCEGSNPAKPLPSGVSAHSMGDNDLWIAATTSVVRGTLVTTDKDFKILDGVFLSVIQVDPRMK
jgi:tRNA(fMet)-specific endonuclease VapC